MMMRAWLGGRGRVEVEVEVELVLPAPPLEAVGGVAVHQLRHLLVLVLRRDVRHLRQTLSSLGLACLRLVVVRHSQDAL